MTTPLSMPSLRQPGTLVWLVPLAVYVYHALLFRHYVVDDAYITFRYSRSLAEGGGPYFNPGEHVEGYTNFLLMLLLSGVAKLVGVSAMPGAAKAIGLFCGAGALSLSFVLTSRLAARNAGSEGWLAGLLAAGLLAVSPGFAVSSDNGLETTLFSVLLTAGVLLGEAGSGRRNWCFSAIAFGAAVLTRPEAILIFVTYWIASTLYASRCGGWNGVPLSKRLLGAGLVAIVCLAQLLFRLHTYGDWLPNTYYAKRGAVDPREAWNYVRDGALVPLGGVLPTTFAFAALLLPGPARGRYLVVAAPALAGALLPFAEGTDWMQGWRFSAPYLPLLVVTAALGWTRVLDRLSMSRTPRLAIYILLIGGVWILQSGVYSTLRKEIEIDAKGFVTGHMALADWLAHHSHPGDTIAMMDVGIVGYALPEQRMLDITGLTDRTIGRSLGGFLGKEYPSSYVLDQAPRFIVLVAIVPHGTTQFALASSIENRLYNDPAFKRDYIAKAAPDTPTTEWDVLAQHLGAEQIFPHPLPDSDYLLLLFERRPLPRL